MTKPDRGVALVTGASTGIGRAAAEALRDAGYRVFGTSRKSVPQRFDGITMLICDVASDASVAKLVNDVLAETGRIGDNDIMVPTGNSTDMAKRIPGAQLVIYEDAGHGGIFQNHTDFVQRALTFLNA